MPNFGRGRSRTDSAAVPVEWGGGALLHSGYLHKMGHMRPSWKERFFELRSSPNGELVKLAYFADTGGGSGGDVGNIHKKRGAAKGAIVLSGAMVSLNQPPPGVVAA